MGFFWRNSLTKPPFWMTPAQVANVCPVTSPATWCFLHDISWALPKTGSQPIVKANRVPFIKLNRYLPTCYQGFWQPAKTYSFFFHRFFLAIGKKTHRNRNVTFGRKKHHLLDGREETIALTESHASHPRCPRNWRDLAISRGNPILPPSYECGQGGLWVEWNEV